MDGKCNSCILAILSRLVIDFGCYHCIYFSYGIDHLSDMNIYIYAMLLLLRCLGIRCVDVSLKQDLSPSLSCVTACVSMSAPHNSFRIWACPM